MDTNNILFNLIDSYNNFSDEDKELLAKDDLSVEELKKVMSKYSLSTLF